MTAFYAVPGSMLPGSVWPGDTLSIAAAGLLIFTGGVTLTYPQYLDAQTQKTLVAQPGGVYGVQLASGYPGAGPVPDDGRWIAAGS